MSVYPLIFSGALLMTSLGIAISARWIIKPTHRTILAIVLFALSFVPIPGASLSFYLAGITGNLSITTLILLTLYLVVRCTGVQTSLTISKDLPRLYILVSIAALVLFPSALGASLWDFYAEGYYPVILAPLIFTIFTLCVFRSWYFLASIIALSFIAYGFNLFESNNFWDYLLDPLLSIFCLIKLPGVLRSLRTQVNKEALQVAALSFAGSYLLFSVFLSRINEDAFRYRLVKEDGFVESATAITLFIVLLISLSRVVKLRHVRSYAFLGMTAFVGIVGLFGAGEEISWGQRIFNWETPEYFMKHNKQGETGLHNFVFEINGKKLSANKVIFGTGLAIAMLFYLAVMTPLYRQHKKRDGPFSTFIDNLAIPMPQNYHIIGYLIVVATVELLVDSSKRGEMTEFAGSIIFLLNVAFPYNHEIFNVKET